MKKIVLCILIINFLKVDCGLLKGILSPVTEKVQNNALLDEHAHKEEAEKKGLVTNLVEGIDTVFDPLTGLLKQGNKDNANKTETKNDTKVADNKNPDVKDDSPTKISNNTIDMEILNDTKDAVNVADAAKDNLSTTTPGTDVRTDLTTEILKDKDCKGEDCTEKPKIDDTDVDVTKRVNFDGNQCPTGTERADDNTCKEVQ